jgi:hypothetical protein
VSVKSVLLLVGLSAFLSSAMAGASSWSYFVPYQKNINKALQELRQQVFREGDYYKPAEFAKRMYADGTISKKELDAWLKGLQSEPEPKTIRELIDLRADEGTHAIIDIERVSDTLDYSVVMPLTAQEYQKLFSTAKPTHALVKKKESELWGLRKRWVGVYVIVYKGGEPDEIFFGGFSGD